METSWDEDSGGADVGELLLSIHLERYQDSFRQRGFHKAKDFIHLDNEILLQMGITATGHRKRILKLVPQGELPQDVEPFWDGPQPDPAPDEAPPEELASPWDPKGLPNNCLPDIPGATAEPHRDLAESVEKPIPKPRTIFNKPKTEPPTKPPQKCTSNSFIVLEDFAPGESSTDAEERGSEPGEDRLSNCGSLESLTKEEQSAGNLPPVPPRIHRGIPPASFTGQGSPGRGEQDKLSTPPLSSSPGSCCSFGEGAGSTSPTPLYPGMEMISNEIYSGLSQSQMGVTASALEMCRNRPVPLPPARLESSSSLEKYRCEITFPTHMTLGPDSGDISLREASLFSVVHQEEVISPYCETVFQRDRPNREQKVSIIPCLGFVYELLFSRRRALLKEQRISQILLSESEGYSTVGEHHAPSQSFSLPLDMYGDEIGDDLTISPYASFTSLPDRAQPIISGWLEKLSPQGAVFWRPEVYPKGVIPLAAIQMARTAKDNKFEIVTSQRTFVFRADTEAQRNEWSSTLQNRVKDQLVFSRPRFGPGSHCQKSGYLELKGTKSKIYVAINTDQVWLHKNEQGFKNGIGITLIDVRGSTIRDNKSKSFELISPFKVFSFTAESEREKKEWMEALQESIAETLSDYEVAEKIWSNRSNRACADCKAYNPDWASINLCVIICKNCAGQHRGLGTTISKVQSLKLDTSVWSNEIVQLFIMLGNEKANAFWAARLPSGDELDPDAPPDQRREFIGLKYRDGKYRRPHPHFNTQEELLKPLSLAGVTSQNENNEKKDILVLVEMGRTLYLQSMARMDFSMWYADIQTAAGGKGNALRDQQLSRNGIPIIVDSCISFLTQYGNIEAFRVVDIQVKIILLVVSLTGEQGGGFKTVRTVCKTFCGVLNRDLLLKIEESKSLSKKKNCSAVKVSPMMSAEELTNQVLYMRNIPAGDKDIWLTFEAMESSELERPLHPKEKVLEQALQWCKLPEPSSAYLVVKKIPNGQAIEIFTGFQSEIVKIGGLKCREEPPKLLQGNKFQERIFQIRDRKLLLLKDKKSNKPEKEWPLKTLKVYLGIRKKLKAPTHSPNAPLFSGVQPMKMQQDSFEEQPSSTEPLYEEVGDFGLQVLKSLQTSFLSGPSEVKTLPLSRPASQDYRKTSSLDRMIGPNPVRTLCVEGSRGLFQSASLERLRSPDHMEPLILEDSCTTDPEGPVRPYPKKTALSTPSQDKLLQELANVFMKKGETGNAASQAGQNIL
ncbi:UNVERIFIED_CONTAM: hypothetical protein FKN15_056021 [Acipenser sinensis]